MKLITLTAKNYRTLENIEVSFNSDYCTISGPNNAGKSSIVRMVDYLFRSSESRAPYFGPPQYPEYSDNITKWIQEDDDIYLSYKIQASRKDDRGLFQYLEKTANTQKDDLIIEVSFTISNDEKEKILVTVDGKRFERYDARELIRKIRSLRTLYVHDPSHLDRNYLFRQAHFGEAHFLRLSNSERQELHQSESTLNRKIKRLAKRHKEEINDYLGKLQDKYEVEFTTLDELSSRHIPVGINLKLKDIEVSLPDWGSGTQNRTRIIMLLIQALRQSNQEAEDERVRPIVLIEEPESFLHPQAQAEFGRMLNDISEETGLQIIVATHSPFMLNQKNPKANILIQRKTVYKKPRHSYIVDTGGDDWKQPFAEHLGIMPQEFDSWKRVFISEGSKAILVEGEVDKEYFNFLRSSFEKCHLDADIFVESYGGVDSLKTTPLLQLVLRGRDRAIVTFDLDREKDAAQYLERIGLQKDQDFIAIGRNKLGCRSIEGIIPDEVLTAVQSTETDLVRQLQFESGDNRRKASSLLKKKYLEEFRKTTDYNEEQMKEVYKLFAKLRKKLS
jgi:predicted ATP-dependent endonuclease of OLD family